MFIFFKIEDPVMQGCYIKQRWSDFVRITGTRNILLKLLYFSLTIFAVEMNKFIHQSSALCLAFIIMARIMAMPISLLDYSVNKSFITNNLCENRLRHEIHCAGKCYLNKQLAKSNENKEPGDQKGSIKNLVIDFFEPVNKPLIINLKEKQAFTSHFKVPFISSQFADNIFHPPIA
jgi:hypothetical protein